MITLFMLIIACGAALLWFLPVSKDRTRRMASQIGGASLFAVGIGGTLLTLMGPGAA